MEAELCNRMNGRDLYLKHVQINSQETHIGIFWDSDATTTIYIFFIWFEVEYSYMYLSLIVKNLK